MLVLLAALPYAGAIAMYWLTASNLFKEANGVVPGNWNWRLVAPVMVGGLTPLALAPRDGLTSTERGLLLSGTALAIVYTLVCMTVLRDGKKFFRVQIPVTSRGKSRLSRWRVMLLVGTAVLCWGAAANVIVVGASGDDCSLSWTQLSNAEPADLAGDAEGRLL